MQVVGSALGKIELDNVAHLGGGCSVKIKTKITKCVFEN